MNKNLLITLGASALFLQSASAQSVLVESWENSLDGWTLSPENSAYSASFSSTLGVTDQSYSLALTGTAGPTYGQMIDSPSSLGMTALLANAASVSVDVYAPAGSFGFFLQWDLTLNNTDTGYTSVDGFAFSQTASFGSEKTLTWTIPASIRSAMAASSNPTLIAFQVGGGFTSGNETVYLDNLRVTPVPEPSTIALTGLSALGLLKFGLRRRQNTSR